MTRASVQVSCRCFQWWGSQSSHSTFPAIHLGGSLPQTGLNKPKHQTCASFSSGSFLVKEGSRMKKDQMQDKTEEWSFRSYKENSHETEMPSGKAKRGIVLSSPKAASNMWQRHTVKKSCSSEAVKIGPSNIRKESGHTAKPIPAKLCSPAPTGSSCSDAAMATTWSHSAHHMELLPQEIRHTIPQHQLQFKSPRPISHNDSNNICSRNHS